MPDDNIKRIYWDANVILSYINDHSERAPVIEELIHRARKGEFEIVTSAVSRVEIAFAEREHQAKSLDSDVEASIDALWFPGGPIKRVEFFDLIAADARSFIREGLPDGRALKPLDAIHLATAKRLEVARMETYDSKLHKWAQRAGFPIGDPELEQGTLGIRERPVR